jgi:uncharacterized protein (TIGR02284 family)
VKHKYTIETLFELIAVCRDCEQGFRLCAGYTRDGHLSGVLMTLARQCAADMKELEGTIRQLGADPHRGPEGYAGLRRTQLQWTALACREDGAILEECECGASQLLEVYRNALDEHLPDWLRCVVLRQFEGLMVSHDQIRDASNQRSIHEIIAMSPRGAQAGQ